MLLGLASNLLLVSYWQNSYSIGVFNSTLFPFCQPASLFTLVCIKTKIISICWKTPADVTTPWRMSWTLPTVYLLPAFIALCFQAWLRLCCNAGIHFIVFSHLQQFWIRLNDEQNLGNPWATHTWHQDVPIQTRLLSQEQSLPRIVLLKSRIFFMQQDIQRLGILQRSSCRRYRDKVKSKLARIPGIPGIPTRIPKVNYSLTEDSSVLASHFL